MTLSPYPPEFISYLAEYFGSRDYFECHELMEELWKKEKGSPSEGSWLVLVRIAVAQYHARRGNGRGAYKLLAKAAEEADPGELGRIGLDGARLAAMLRERVEAWGSPDGVFYAELELPIADPLLLRLARELCAARGWAWGAPAEAIPSEVVHRHATRDRSEVIAARAEAADARAKARARSRPG
ncbi:hypothetical protein J19TS2_11030 [Cohnella xylanilytica]|uniref:DUF309 domain-containing protein n=1 Tax=Cohnella xylanilytica TaxID=557555 RepID=A0A841TRG0_9BACL|nr:DUF309 domain-containing protein [Cohnella xylanilytica]MBB6690299.1 DUF309 domain-containing protein [Cohnella xylanilytica]GIO11548.1 hypothetical protein J19TS2_11030 [Cohnella xylanilytica]